jgi:hypothetical protein
MLRRYVGLVEWYEAEPVLYTSWSLHRLRRKVAMDLDGYLRSEWACLPTKADPDSIPALNPDDPRSVMAFIQAVREIDAWGYPSFYRIVREDQPLRLIQDFV